MPRPISNADRVELRSWLRNALRFDLLEHMPPRYDPEGGDRGPRPVDHARRLVNDLGDPSGVGRPLHRSMEDARAFRAWVEAHQRLARRSILHEGAAPSSRASALATAFVLGLARPLPPDRPGRPSRPQDDPMWDRWIDG